MELPCINHSHEGSMGGGRGTVATALSIPRIFLENCNKVNITEQPLLSVKIRHCSVIDNSNGYGYLSII